MDLLEDQERVILALLDSQAMMSMGVLLLEILDLLANLVMISMADLLSLIQDAVERKDLMSMAGQLWQERIHALLDRRGMITMDVPCMRIPVWLDSLGSMSMADLWLDLLTRIWQDRRDVISMADR